MPTAATATGYIGRVGLANPNATSYTSIAKRGQTLELLNKALNSSHGSRRLRATLLALTGAAVGGASKAYSNSRVQPSQRIGKLSPGGLQPVETVTYQTGVTVAGDLTSIDTQIAAKHKPSSYPANKSGYAPGNIGSLARP
jgi:hypothetical protein